MDVFHVCCSPQCVFVSRTEYWARNMLLAGGPTACPACGERYRRGRVYRGDVNITPFDKVMVIHSDRGGRPLPDEQRGR
eukprot:590723-Alexandrium_andersonii.AAC.1